MSLSLWFALPAAVFAVVSILWVIAGNRARFLSVLPLWAPYAMCAILLVLGGLLHRVAHVRLHGFEFDLPDESPAPIPIGGELHGKRPEFGLDVPDLDYQALGLVYENGQLRIVPGPGYRRGTLVRCNGKLVPLEPGGVPRLVGLHSGDTLVIPPEAGGEVIADWRLGQGRFELNAEKQSRVLGSDGTGAARISLLPAQVATVRTRGETLTVAAGPGLSSGLGIMVNGRRLDFSTQREISIPFLSGKTRLAVVKAEPLSGRARLYEQSPLRRSAFVDWEAAQTSVRGFSINVQSGREYTLGGGPNDNLYVRGLISGALDLEVSQMGHLHLKMSRAAQQSVADHEMEAMPDQECEAGSSIRLGAAHAPNGGILKVSPSSNAKAPDFSLQPAAGTDEADEMETTDDEGFEPAPPAAPSSTWVVTWIPNTITRMPLSNRVVTVPLISKPFELLSHRPWQQLIFPLANLSPRESGLRSAFIYGVPHPEFSVNGVTLLQLEPELSVERDGHLLPMQGVPLGVIENGAPVEILQVVADESGGDLGNVSGSPLHPANVYQGKRVRLVEKFSSISVVQTGAQDKRKSVLRVLLPAPITGSVPMSDVTKALDQRELKESAQVRFGINDRNGLSDLPYQLTFPRLAAEFDQANADVELNFSTFNVQDDFGRRKCEYHAEFEIGGNRRLILSLSKEMIPFKRAILIGIAGVIATIAGWMRGRSYCWLCLLHGVGMLTCARVIFTQAAFVNPPYNAEVAETATIAAVAMPIFLLAAGFLCRVLLPGRIDNALQRWETRSSYVRVYGACIILLLLRFALLLIGAKESLSLGFRFSLSIVFVPLWILVNARTCFLMEREKQVARGFTWKVASRFAAAMLVTFLCQAISAVMTSDLGMFLYFIPTGILLAALGAAVIAQSVLVFLRCGPSERAAFGPLKAINAGLLMLVPVCAMGLVFCSPKWILNRWPGLGRELASTEHLVTDSTLLRVLQFADEEYLSNLGTDTAERIIEDHKIMDSYSYRGMLGEGYLQVHLIKAKYVTALNDNVSSIYIFAQFGVVGAVAITVAYLALCLAPIEARGSRNTVTSWAALLAGLSLACVSIYMMLANRGCLPFTGRNMYLLGLNSGSDVAEASLLIWLIILGLERASLETSPAPVAAPAQAESRLPAFR